MKDGFIKVATASPEIRVADCAYNAGQIISAMQEASRKGAKLLVLPELCLTGYTCGDLFLQRVLLDGALLALAQILRQTAQLEMVTIIGLPIRSQGQLYNCAAVLYQGQLLGLVPKSHLPNYGEFYELRHFSPAPEENRTFQWEGRDVPFGSKLLFRCNQLPEFTLGVEICEDLWVPIPPSGPLALAGATVICNPSASDETIGKAAYRRQLLCAHSAQLVCAYLYADAGEGESTTDMVFSGHCLIAENGTLLAQAQPFEPRLLLTEIDVQRLEGERRRLTSFGFEPVGYTVLPFDMRLSQTQLTREVSSSPFVPQDGPSRDARCESILAMQAAGLQKRLRHTAAHTAVIGISGGLDSTLTLLVTCRAFDRLGCPRGEIIAVTMPGFGTSGRTYRNAQALCQRLEVTLLEVNIASAVTGHFADIGQDPDLRDVTYENAQARERTQILMDIANQRQGLVIGTGDLSELALGWATYNGDHMSMYAVNTSIPKTLVRHLVAYAASQSGEALRSVLQDILDTPVSPELLPAAQGQIVQKTEELVGPYALHDFFLYYAIRWAFPPAKVYRLACYAFAGAYDGKAILHWLRTFYRRFFAQQFKRSCLPDGPKVGSVTLSPRGDWRMPSDACAALWFDELERLTPQ